MESIHFRTPEELRSWLEKHHETETELSVMIFKKRSGVSSVDWAQIVDEVLCFGWIDGKGKRIDDDRYTIRITPRKRGSIWSHRNVARVEALVEEGRMRPAGLRAFESRKPERTGIYSFERNAEAEFGPEFANWFQQNPDALAYFGAQANWYRRAATHWVMSAKRDSTRQRRMSQLIADSSAGRTIKPLTRNQ
jgi:uncharacterized protein YdeI (YjbR/CyaY-like superfamily)